MKTIVHVLIVVQTFLCFSAPAQTPGTLKWRFKTESLAESSPAIGNDGTIYFGSWDNNLYALAPDGNKKWSCATGVAISGSPAIAENGTIYIGAWDKKLYAINPDGTIKWSYTAGGSIYSSPAIGSDGTIYFGCNDESLYALTPEGVKKWSYRTGGDIESSPAIDADGTVYVGSEDKKLYAITPEGKVKWSFLTGDCIFSSPAIGVDGIIYFGSKDKKVYALHPDGSLKWSFLTGFNVSAPPVIGSDDTIYIGSLDNNFYALNPDGSEQWHFTAGFWIDGAAAIGKDGTIYVPSDDGNLYALNPDGSQKWVYTVGATNWIQSSPAIASDGTIYFTCQDYHLYAINGNSPGLADTPWPKFHCNNRNSGRQARLDIQAPSLNFALIKAGEMWQYAITVFNGLDESVTVTQCHFSNSEYTLVTPLPLQIIAASDGALMAEATVLESSLLNSDWEIIYSKGGQQQTASGSIMSGLFIDDGSETAVTARRAIAAWQACKAKNVNSPASVNNTSVLFRLLNEDALATVYNQTALSKALNEGHGYAGIIMNLGIIRSDQGHAQAADSAYYTALSDVSETSSLSPQLYYNQAWEDYHTDSLHIALDKVNITLSSTKTNSFLKAKAYVLRGAIHVQLGQFNDARDDFQQAVQMDPDGPIGQIALANLITDVSGEPQILPQEFVLLPNYPNPFNPLTCIRYAVPRPANVTMAVFNVRGQRIRTLIQEMQPAGWHEISWDGRDDGGLQAGSGVYILQAQSGEWREVRKITLVK